MGFPVELCLPSKVIQSHANTDMASKAWKKDNYKWARYDRPMKTLDVHHIKQARREIVKENAAYVRSIVKAVNVVFPWRQAFKDVIVQALPQSEEQSAAPPALATVMPPSPWGLCNMVHGTKY
eukprot:1138208-Pelagomonas_calceolata.AAC.2